MRAFIPSLEIPSGRPRGAYRRLLSVLLVLSCFPPFSLPILSALQEEPIMEEFNSLDGWEELLFPRIPRHSAYRITELEGNTVLELSSNSSASALVHRSVFDPKDMSILSWRWKIGEYPHRENQLTKQGDDYPVRIYVLFEYDPENPGSAGRLRYRIAKLLYGEFPPHSTLNFVWANELTEKNSFPNPYTERAMMIVKDRGSGGAGMWRSHEVDILEEYRRAFGEDPPRRAAIAVMADSDNTGTATRGWIDFIRVERRQVHPEGVFYFHRGGDASTAVIYREDGQTD